MTLQTAIEWTDATWNPVTGCTKISDGCDHCYAERFSERFRNVKDHPFEQGFDLTLRPARIQLPLQWKKPQMIFVNSMSDLFHKQVPTPFVDQVFETMERGNWHRYQVLTKRSSRLRDYVNRRYEAKGAPQHIWLGTSVEDRRRISRIRHIQDTNAHVRFLSVEPLLAPMGSLDLSGISWVIVGGESGPGARRMLIDWVREIRDQCIDSGVPFFFKQWGGIRPKSGGRLLDGREWSEWPLLQDRQVKRISEKLRNGRPESNGVGVGAAHARQARDLEALPAGVDGHSQSGKISGDTLHRRVRRTGGIQ